MQADSPPGSHQPELRREMGQYERDAAVIREFQALTIMQCVLLWLLSFVRHESGMHIWILYLNAFEMFEMPLFMQKISRMGHSRGKSLYAGVNKKAFMHHVM